MSPKLETSVDGKSFTPGDTVEGTVQVSDGGRSRALELFLIYRDTSPDYSGLSVSVPGGKFYVGDLESGQTLPFSIDLPDDAKPNFDSAHGRLWWEVHVKSDEFGLDTHAAAPMDVA